ncbi:MAG: 16S rRNA (uracil(1498)-N(3))-methyltransferase [Endomicrobium sp.]|jgi:16S rRNA (uracil1498-N3)-methyltransferase|nr:16S rRNA (uracil(1498)-N(3))-methyltransferase [Endomicrobium sp.]
MTHFYVKPENIEKTTFTITDMDEQLHYIYNVRRFKLNDEIMIFDGIGNSYKAKINYINKNLIMGNILSSSYKIPWFIVKLYVSISKTNRFEWLIEKCVEIGVSEIILISAKRSTNIIFSKNKLKRYKKIAITASSQCRRNDIVKINESTDFKSACENAIIEKNLISILLWENENNSENKTFVNNIFKEKLKYNGINIFIGPEGGFENEEIEFAKSLGIQTVTLGENILRVETAAIVATALTLNYSRIFK